LEKKFHSQIGKHNWHSQQRLGWTMDDNHSIDTFNKWHSQQQFGWTMDDNHSVDTLNKWHSQQTTWMNNGWQSLNWYSQQATLPTNNLDEQWMTIIQLILSTSDTPNKQLGWTMDDNHLVDTLNKKHSQQSRWKWMTLVNILEW
jgi:hypothetical protein